MTDYPMTFAEWSKASPDVMASSVVNTMIEDNPLLRMLPISPWSGGQSYSWVLNGTLPTIAAIDETSTMTATKSVRKKLSTYLSQYGGDIQIPVFTASTMSGAIAEEDEDVADLCRAMGDKMRSELILGNWMTEANATLKPAVVATPYIDAVTAISANMPSGTGWFKYTHSGTYLAFKAPGSSTFGTNVACASDGDYTVADGEDATKKITVTVDVSDLGANAEWAGVVFQRPEEVSGLYELAQLDTAQIVTPSTNGDAVSLALLDKMAYMVKGPNAEKAFLMNARTRQNVAALYRAAGGAMPADLRAENTMPGAMPGPHGIPMIECPDIAITETQGGTTSSCGRVYCVRFNAQNGLHLLYGAQRGPNFGTMGATDDSDSGGSSMTLPVYLRKLGEGDALAAYKWRITTAVALVLKRSLSCSMAYGITN